MRRAALVLVLAGFSACRSKRAAAPDAHVLRLALVGTVITLDAPRIGWVMEARVIEQMADGLVELDANLQVQPSLAESWEVLEGGQAYRFRLREGASWGDGQPLRASEVVAALSRLAAPGDLYGFSVIADVEGAEAHRDGKAASISGLEAPDERTMVVRLRRPSSRFLYQLTSAGARIFVGNGTPGDWERGRVPGTGPFRLEGWEEAEVGGGGCQRLRFTARSRQPRPSRVGRVAMDIYRSGADLLRGLRREPYDIVFAPPLDRPAVEELLPRHRLRLVPRLAFLGLYFDCTKPPVDRAEARRAIVLGADRDVLPGTTPPRVLFLPGRTAEDAILPPDAARARPRSGGRPRSRPSHAAAGRLFHELRVRRRLGLGQRGPEALARPARARGRGRGTTGRPGPRCQLLRPQGARLHLRVDAGFRRPVPLFRHVPDWQHRVQLVLVLAPGGGRGLRRVRALPPHRRAARHHRTGQAVDRSRRPHLPAGAHLPARLPVVPRHGVPAGHRRGDEPARRDARAGVAAVRLRTACVRLNAWALVSCWRRLFS